MSDITPAGVIHDAIMDSFGNCISDTPTSSACHDAAETALSYLRYEYDTITLNGQRYLLIPEPSPTVKAAA